MSAYAQSCQNLHTCTVAFLYTQFKEGSFFKAIGPIIKVKVFCCALAVDPINTAVHDYLCEDNGTDLEGASSVP